MATSRLRYERCIVLIAQSVLIPYVGSLEPRELRGCECQTGPHRASHCFPRSCCREALTKTPLNCPWAVSFQTLLSQDQLLNDSRLATPNSEDWR